MLNIYSKMLESASIIFWDFDGVIKESVDVKTAAYESIFAPYGSEVVNRVRQHHEENGGITRYEKIPKYLDWVGESNIPGKIEEFCLQFSHLVVQAVIDSPWVPGVREYLLKHHRNQYFVLVTATPEEEIRVILSSLELLDCFKEVFGAPTKKVQAIRAVLVRLKCNPNEALMIGDSESDLIAANANSVPFLLRRTPLNKGLRANPQYSIFDDLGDE